MPLDCQKKQIQSGGIVNFNLEEEQELDSEEDTNNLSISSQTQNSEPIWKQTILNGKRTENEFVVGNILQSL